MRLGEGPERGRGFGIGQGRQSGCARAMGRGGGRGRQHAQAKAMRAAEVVRGDGLAGLAARVLGHDVGFRRGCARGCRGQADTERESHDQEETQKGSQNRHGASISRSGARVRSYLRYGIRPRPLLRF